MVSKPVGGRDWAEFAPSCVDGTELLNAHFVRHRFERHSHPVWCFGVTLAGQQVFRCRGTTSTGRNGHVIVFRPDEAHDGHAGDAAGFRYAMLYAPQDVVSTWLAEAGVRSRNHRFASALIGDASLAQHLAVGLEAAGQAGESLRGSTLMAEAVLRLFERHAALPGPGVRERRDARWLRGVRDYIAAHHAEDIRVEALAQLAQVSRVHLTRAFTLAYGIAPHQYLNSVRLDSARRLLAQGLSMADAAVAAGFSDQSHFSRRFRGGFGLTPGAWLQQRSGPGRAGAAALSLPPPRRS